MTQFSLEWVLIVVRGAVLTGAMLWLGFVLRRWRREAGRDTQRVFEQLDLLRAELLTMQDQLAQISNAPATAVEQRPAAEPRVATVASAAAPRGYEVAARLARSGASVDELMSSCGLSRHEAALLLRLHGAAHQQHRGVETKPSKQAETDSAKAAAPLRKSRLSVVG